MRTSSLDIPEKAELPHPQAHAILKVMELELTASHELWATKAETKAEFALVRAEIAEVRADLTAFRAEVAARFEAVATKGELQQLGSQLSWMVLGCTFTQLAFLAGAVYFLYAHPGR